MTDERFPVSAARLDPAPKEFPQPSAEQLLDLDQKVQEKVAELKKTVDVKKLETARANLSTTLATMSWPQLVHWVNSPFSGSVNTLTDELYIVFGEEYMRHRNLAPREN